MAAVVEAEAIDNGPVANEPEDARARIAGLRPGRQAADFGKSAAHGERGARHPRVLVKAGGNADRVRELETPKLDAKPPVIGFHRAGENAELEGAQRHLVSLLGLQSE